SFGEQALQIATLIKLTRALWIIPLAFATMFIFRDKTGKVSIPWFIFLFVLAMVINTYVSLPQAFVDIMVWVARRGMVVTLFMIGASLTVKMMKSVGVRPLLLAVLLWVVISVSSLFVVLHTIDVQ
ncbi:MAG: putative sulfate exporter family transporter, partial [Muribaculaceae bacterium]|nr:putative sulfate exporter family transporter [Muribaculaceae bacterium]